MMQRKTIQLLVISVMGMWSVSAQQSEIYTHKLSEYDKALQLYKEKQYQSAQILFERTKSKEEVVDVHSDCAYYIGVCAIYLNQCR
jgi:HJR/Mrr/RecB family endonuclease